MRKSLKIRDWEKAQQIIRDWEAEGTPAPIEAEEAPNVTIERVCQEFIAEAESRELKESTLRK